MIITIILVAAALAVGYVLEDTYGAISKWFKARRKFVCAVCKKKRRKHEGYTPMALDVDVSPTVGQPYLVPLNLVACAKCVPLA